MPPLYLCVFTTIPREHDPGCHGQGFRGHPHCQLEAEFVAESQVHKAAYHGKAFRDTMVSSGAGDDKWRDRLRHYEVRILMLFLATACLASTQCQRTRGWGGALHVSHDFAQAAVLRNFMICDAGDGTIVLVSQLAVSLSSAEIDGIRRIDQMILIRRSKDLTV